MSDANKKKGSEQKDSVKDLEQGREEGSQTANRESGQEAASLPEPVAENPAGEIEAKAPAAAEPGRGDYDEEEIRDLEPSPELQSALAEAIESVEKTEEKKRGKKEPEIKKPSEEEQKLKLEIIDLKRRLRELEAEIEQKVKEIKQNYEQGMLIKNQFEAYKSRVMKEKSDWFNYGFEPILKELLPVIDNFERALSHAQRPEDLQSLKEGIELISRQLLQVLETFGVKQIQALNQNFDPAFHEAISQVASNQHPDNTVIEEHTKGYMLKDRLLRAARVTVSRAPAGEQKNQIVETGSKESEGASEKESEPKDKAGKGDKSKGC